ncbi:2422_t:CDS:2, partial [Acaulospora colombiana]
DLVAGEGEGGHGTRALDQVISPNAQNQRRGGNASGSGEDNSQGWENVPSDSLTSSYPSINFPPLEGDATNDPQRHPHGSSHRGEGPVLALPAVAPPSVTLSVFDSSLSRRARLLALASSLAINLLLPFINGVMLGFGEIAAKSVFNWGGWSSVAGALGLGSGSSHSRTMATSPRTKGKGAPILLTLQ